MTLHNTQASAAPCIEVENLAVVIRDPDRRNPQGQPLEQEMVSGVSFQIGRGETLGLVGESGCGKSLTAMSLVDLLPRPQVARSGGRIRFAGEEISTYDRRQMAALRGHKISVIFQDPMTALNPVHRAGQQIDEVLRLHFPKMSRQQRLARCIELIRDVGIPAPEQRVNAYPHQLSGGMRQRLMIAMALAGEPELLIADEPTTALDVTIQAQIVSLLKALQQRTGMAMLFITHDLGLVSQVSDRVAVMYAGKIVEQRTVNALFKQPLHPYTKGLIAALPSAAQRAPKSALAAMPGQVPALDALPKGCRFANRCNHATDECHNQAPTNEPTDSDTTNLVACHRWRELSGDVLND